MSRQILTKHRTQCAAGRVWGADESESSHVLGAPPATVTACPLSAARASPVLAARTPAVSAAAPLLLAVPALTPATLWAAAAAPATALVLPGSTHMHTHTQSEVLNILANSNIILEAE